MLVQLTYNSKYNSPERPMHAYVSVIFFNQQVKALQDIQDDTNKQDMIGVCDSS